MILKPGKDAENVNSYRPISLLSIKSKIFEQVVRARLTRTIEENNLIPDIQFGYRRGTPSSKFIDWLIKSMQH
jgi:hypothetical protein